MFINRRWVIRDGKLSDVVVNFIRNQKGEYELIMKKITKPRSIKSNSFYWVYLTIIQNETGNDKDDLHELFKRIFLPPQIIKVLDREIKIPGSTTKLDSGQFSEYLSKIERETGIPCPDPNELYLN